MAKNARDLVLLSSRMARSASETNGAKRPRKHWGRHHRWVGSVLVFLVLGLGGVYPRLWVSALGGVKPKTKTTHCLQYPPPHVSLQLREVATWLERLQQRLRQSGPLHFIFKDFQGSGAQSRNIIGVVATTLTHFPTPYFFMLQGHLGGGVPWGGTPGSQGPKLTG